MSNALTPLQRLCLDRYCGGEFKALDSMQQVYEAGDSLLTFVMLEAADIPDPRDMTAALERAAKELWDLRWWLEKEAVQ